MEIIERFFKYLMVKNYSERTLQVYRDNLNQFLKYIAGRGKEYAQVRTDDLIDYIGEMRMKNWAVNTINIHLTALRSFYNYLFKQGYHDGHLEIPYPKNEKRTIKILSVEEIKRILNAIELSNIKGARDKALIELLYVTGMRIGEFVNITSEDFQFIRLKKGNKQHLVIHVHGKGMRERNIYVNEDTAGVVLAYLAQREDNCPYLFVSHVRDRIAPLGKSTLRDILRARAKKARVGKKIYPHVFRHSIATHLLQAGVNIYVIQRFLGHSSLASTQQYLSLLDIDYRSACEEVIPKILYSR